MGQIALYDEAEEEQRQQFEQAIEAVTDSCYSGVKVGFHCGGGNDRTGAVAIGTLLELEVSKSIEDAEETLHTLHPISRAVFHVLQEINVMVTVWSGGYENNRVNQKKQLEGVRRR